MTMAKNLNLEKAFYLISEIERTDPRPPEHVLLALIYEELKKLNKKTDRKEKQ
jgi:hypothetical protein